MAGSPRVGRVSDHGRRHWAMEVLSKKKKKKKKRGKKDKGIIYPDPPDEMVNGKEAGKGIWRCGNVHLKTVGERVPWPPVPSLTA